MNTSLTAAMLKTKPHEVTYCCDEARIFGRDARKATSMDMYSGCQNAPMTFFPRVCVNGSLSTDGRVDHGEQGGGDLHDAYAAHAGEHQTRRGGSGAHTK